MEQVERGGAHYRGFRWNVLVPAAAAALVILLGIMAGSYISFTMIDGDGRQTAEVPGFEYLEAYPPDSFGEVIQVATVEEVSDE
jgi:hypothetical protein